MKKVLFFVTLFITATFATSHAAIITVDNKTPSVGDYPTLQEAHDAANPGDTVYVCPSEAYYQAITVSKKLNIVGTGFSPPSEGMMTTLITGTMTFSAGSDGSSLEGFKSNGLLIVIDANDITIKRNSIVKKITINESHSGTVILQNYIYNYAGVAHCRYGCEPFVLVEVKDSNEVFIANNVLMNPVTGFEPTQNYAFLNIGINAHAPTITITVLHNIFYLPYPSNKPPWEGKTSFRVLNIDQSNKFVANNIIINGVCNGTSSGYFYNMSNWGQLPEGNGNMRNVDMSTVFVDWANDDFNLLPDSPVIGTGQNGVDMGIYGGSTPFADGGTPGLPSIFHLESDHMGSQTGGLDVTIKAKSNRE